MSIDLRPVLHSQDAEYPPGRLAEVKRGETSDPGYPQPQAAEVESARLLANDARPALRATGLSDEDIGRLADDFIAEDRGEATEAFIGWAVRCATPPRRPAGAPADAASTGCFTATCNLPVGSRPFPAPGSRSAAACRHSERPVRLPASRNPKMTAHGGRQRMLAVQTPDRPGGILDADGQPHPTIGRCGMSQLRITKHRTVGPRRRREPVLPLDPRDPDLIRAKHLQRRRARSGTGRSRAF